MSASRCFAILLAAVPVVAQTPEPATPEDTTPVAVAPPALLADTQDRLSTALHSFRLLQDEADLHRAEIQRLAAENSLLKTRLAEAGTQSIALQDRLMTAAAAGAQAELLRNQLRQTQDQLSVLIAENAQLRTRLALTAAPPGGLLAVPSRPVQVAAAPASAPAVTATDLMASEPRYHTVVEGDTLSKIAREYYGDSKRWPEILEANRTLLQSDRSLRFGVKLLIP
jgi:nucleoid-associated protein YgaU